MNAGTDTIKPPVEASDCRHLGEASDILHRAICLNEVLFMAGESLPDRDAANAITMQCDFISNLLNEVEAILCAHWREDA